MNLALFQAAIAKEAMRRKHIEEMIDAIRNTVFVSPREASASIEAIIAATEALDVSEAIYEEFAPAASRAKAETLESLRETLDLAKCNEADQARIKAEQEAAKQAEELAERLKREANAPQSGEIVTLIADHYRISHDAALDWLRVMFGDVRQAA